MLGRERKIRRAVKMGVVPALENKRRSNSHPEVVSIAACTGLTDGYYLYYYFCRSVTKAMVINNSLTFRPLLTLLLNFKKNVSLAGIINSSLLSSKSVILWLVCDKLFPCILYCIYLNRSQETLSTNMKSSGINAKLLERLFFF